MSKCGSGGTSKDLVPSSFARSDGEKFEYVFNHDKFGETPRQWALAPGRLEQSAYSYQLEALDKDLTKKSCKMMHGGSEEAELSAADLLELEAQNSKSSLYSTDLQVQSSSSSIVKKNGWFDFRAKADQVKKANPAYSSKQVCKKVEQDWVNELCQARDASKMCQRSGVKENCEFSCSGPVNKQPEICGFIATFNYLRRDAAVTVSDDCVA